MAALFLDIAQACAQMVAPETLAAVVSVESGFAPLAIRINSGLPLPEQPKTKAEAIEIATTLVTEGHNVDIGLGGVNVYELRRLGLSVSDLFDPCANLKATATLLDGYYQVAIKAGASPVTAETAMLRSYYGQGDVEAGTLAGYDRRIADEKKRIAPRLLQVALLENRAGDLPAREFTGTPVRTEDPAATPGEVAKVPSDVAKSADADASAPSWDVFGKGRQSSVLVFSR